ncbi:MAG TPA: four helix bundle protein [Solimonas sp.]|nr:four helix bundle protein [Solimonas sp.]
MKRPHYKLEVWGDAIRLAKLVYEYCVVLPDTEKFGLSRQMKRSSVSVGSNIAEGVARGSTADYVRFLHMARGSLAELDTQLAICRELGFTGAAKELGEQLDKVFAKLNALIRSLTEKAQ